MLQSVAFRGPRSTRCSERGRDRYSIGMHSSSAFEAIEDPLDPAWHGHAPDSADDDRWGGRGRVLAIAAALVVVALLVAGVVMVTDRGGVEAEGTETAQVAADADADVRPSAVVAADVIPATPAEPAEPAAPVVARTAAAAEPAAATPGSGWAPAAATIAPEDSGSGLVKGDLTGIHPELLRRLDALAVATGREIEVISGWRTRHEQEDLYDSFLSGAGNLAAVPGTSNHETGRAADVYVDGVALASVEGVGEQAAALGLHFPVGGEPWHAEMVGY